MAVVKEGFELIKGMIDIHIHSGPDIFPRLMDDIQLAEDARDCGMAAILIKNHATTTADRAQMAAKVAKFPVFGGVVLNNYVGGINPDAVKASCKKGAKEVWFPTIQAKKYLANKSHVPMFDKELSDKEKPLYLLDENGKLIPAVHDVLDVIAEYKVIMATGHISFEEALPLVKAAKAHKIEKILVTHPLASFVHYTVDQMKEILDAGATFLEHVYNDTTRQVANPFAPSVLADGIKAIGAKYCVMSTDSGQVVNERPVIMMRHYVQDMLDCGISYEDIQTMTITHPKQLLDL